MRKYIFFTVALLIFFIPLYFLYAQEDQNAFLHKKCVELYSASAVDKAIEVCNQSIEKNPQNTESKFILAKSYFKKKNFSKALQVSNEILPFDENGDYNALQGEIRIAMNDYSSALNNLRSAVKKNPRNAITYKNLCIAAQFASSFDEALTACNKSLKINPDYGEAYFERGNVLQSLLRFSQSLYDYDRAIAINPTVAKYWINRGSTKQQLGDYESALYDFNQAISARGDIAYAYYNRGISYVYLNNMEKACSDFTKAILLNKNYPEAYLNRGIAYQLSNNKVAACADFQVALKRGLQEAQKLLDDLQCSSK